jgi:hypothetical protein
MSIISYSISNNYLPNTESSVIYRYKETSNIDLKQQYINYVQLYNNKYNNLNIINSQILVLQNYLNSLLDKKNEDRMLYIAIEQNILTKIKNIITDMNTLTYNQNNYKNIYDKYSSLSLYIDQEKNKLDDYYTELHNNMTQILQYSSLINDNYNRYNKLNLYLNITPFNIYCNEEQNTILNSTPSRNNPDLLILLCELNNIEQLNAVYIPLPNMPFVTGNDVYINNIQEFNQNILDLQLIF